MLLGPAATASALRDATTGLIRYGVNPADAPRIPITGIPARAVERFRQYAEADASHLILGVIGYDWRDQCELIAEARDLAGPALIRRGAHYLCVLVGDATAARAIVTPRRASCGR